MKLTKMNRAKKWILLCTLAGPTVTTLSCSGTFVRQLRDAAIEGTTTFVSSTTFDFFGTLINFNPVTTTP